MSRDVHITVDAADLRAAIRELREENPPRNTIDATALIHSTSVVWHYAVILQNVEIGHNCSVGSFTEIGRGTKIGNYTRIGSQCFFPPDSRIGHGVFVGPGVRCADDRHPKVHLLPTDLEGGLEGLGGEKRKPAYLAEPPIIEDDAVIGLGAILLPGVRIGKGAIVAAGAIVTRDVPPGGTVKSEPARPFVLSDASREKFKVSA